MEQVRVTLPVRLLPRRRSLIFNLCFFVAFFAFAVFWTLTATVEGTRLEFLGGEVTDPKWRALFPLCGIPFILVGLGGLVFTVLKMLPGNPYFHIDVTADVLRIRGVTKERSLAWHDLPPLTLKIDNDSEGGSSYWVVAADRLTGKEILTIPVDQYGTKDSEQAAAELTAWLNSIRELSLQGRVHAGTQVEVPDGFARRVIRLPAMAGSAIRTERTVTRVG